MQSKWLLVLSFLILLSWTITAEQFYVVPSSNTGCPRDHCYTLTDVVQDPTQYFASNTVITFLPGYHQTIITGNITVLIKDMRNISMIGYAPTNDLRSVIQCTGSLGFAFINVTTLKIMNLIFSTCGAYYPSDLTVIEKLVYPHDYETNILLAHVSKATLYFLQTVNVTISEVTISNSTGAGLLGINILGVSNISQAIFSGNKPNCLLIFMDIVHIFSKDITPTVLNIVESQSSTQSQGYHPYATGLCIKLTQTTYNIHVYINKITSCSNTGMRYEWHSNLYIVIKNWMCHCSMIEATQILSTNTPGKYDVAQVSLKYGNGSLHTCTCASEKNYMVHISDSKFVGSGLSVESDKKYSDARILLENITIQNCTQPTPLRITSMLSIRLQDMKFIYNLKGMIAIHSNITANGNIAFTYNTGHSHVLVLGKSAILFHGDIKFASNEAKAGGGILAINSTIMFRQTVEFVENKGRVAGAIALYKNSRLVVQKSSKVTFLRNHAQQNGGAILADVSTIIVESYANITFIENKGNDGGALALQNGATIKIGLHSQVIFARNHAQEYGGAMYVSNPDTEANFVALSIHCFFWVDGKRVLPSFVFQHNTAGIAGNSVYGGWVDICSKPGPSFDTITYFANAAQELSTVSSDPTRVCVCINNLPDCNITQYNVTAYPGETFQIPAVAVGQWFGTVPFTVRSKFTSVNSGTPPQMKRLQVAQEVRGVCTKLTYTILPRHQKEEMILSVDKSNVPYKSAADIPRWASKAVLLQFTNLQVYIRLHPCPLGFVLYNSSCICHPQLKQHAINCSIDSQKIYRPSSTWVMGTVINSQYGVIVHEHCPFDYCKPDSFDLNLEHPDKQCAFHRSGILCGACQHNIVRKWRVKASHVRSALKKVFYKQNIPQDDTQPRVHLARTELRESLLEYCSEFN